MAYVHMISERLISGMVIAVITDIAVFSSAV
jgi:hypothetical protein